MLLNDPSPESPRRSALPRRAVVSAGAWSIPVVAAATAAPTFAASACVGGTARAVQWQANTTNDNNFTTQAGTVIGNSITVTSDYQGTAGSRAARNMAAVTVTTARDSFEISNNIPSAGTANIENNYQLVTFTFPNKVSSLTFNIDDIDSTNTSTAFHDRVAVIAEPGGTASGVRGSSLLGDGSVGDPWRTSANPDTGDYATRQSVAVTVSGGFKTFQIRYWTSLGASSTAQMWIRIRNMQVSNCV